MMTYLCLHHGRPLSAKVADGLEHVNNTLILHTLKHLTQGDENPSATHTRTENENTINYLGVKHLLQCPIFK